MQPENIGGVNYFRVILVEDDAAHRDDLEKQFKVVSDTLFAKHHIRFELVDCPTSLPAFLSLLDTSRHNGERIHLALIDFYLRTFPENGDRLALKLLEIFPTSYFLFISQAPGVAAQKLTDAATDLPGSTDERVRAAHNQQLATIHKKGDIREGLYHRLEDFLQRYAGAFAVAKAKPIKRIVMSPEFGMAEAKPAGPWCLRPIAGRERLFSDDPFHTPAPSSADEAQDRDFDWNETPTLWIRYVDPRSGGTRKVSPEEIASRCRIEQQADISKDRVPGKYGYAVGRRFYPVVSFGLLKDKSVHISNLSKNAEALKFARMWNFLCRWILLSPRGEIDLCAQNYKLSSAGEWESHVCFRHIEKPGEELYEQTEWMMAYARDWTVRPKQKIKPKNPSECVDVTSKLIVPAEAVLLSFGASEVLTIKGGHDNYVRTQEHPRGVLKAYMCSVDADGSAVGGITVELYGRSGE